MALIHITHAETSVNAAASYKSSRPKKENVFDMKEFVL